jgi:CubicO group peptidase (beta-lactamase class C family)
MPLDCPRLQELLDETAGRLGIAGAQLSVFDGAEQVDVATGLAHAGRGEVVTTGTLFQVGSTTKVFNAVLAHQLADAGRLDLDGPVTDVLPRLRLAARPAGKLSVLDLISMRSGIDNGPYTDFGPGDDAIARYVDALAEIPLLAEPGARFGYSNAGTVIAGRVIELLTGLSWEEALRRHVLEPAGLGQSAASFHELPYHAVAVGHTPAQGGKAGVATRPFAHPRALAPAGSTLCMSAGDLVRFARLILAGGGEVMSKRAVDALQTPQVNCPPILLADAWGAGSFWRRWDGRVVVGHSGTNLGGSSTLLWLPELGGAIATTVNVPRLGYPLAAAVFAEVFPAAFGVRHPPMPEPDPSIAVDGDPLVGRYGAYGVEHVVTREAGDLVLTTSSTLGLIEPIRVRLQPVGPLSFLPDDIAASGNRGYALCFVQDGAAPASHFMHGPFLTRRLGDA